jgi:hypothetical protein
MDKKFDTKVSHFSTKVKIILVLIFTSLILPGALSQTVSFAQPDTLTQKDIYLYAANGTLLGLYNTTSTGIELPNDTDLIFTIKPQYSTPLDDPSGFLGGLIAAVQTNATTILLLGLIGVMLFKR